MALLSVRMEGTTSGPSALECSTLLEVTEAGTVYSHKSCTGTSRCFPFALDFKGEIGCKHYVHSSLPVCVRGRYFGSRFWNFRRFLEVAEAVTIYPI